MLLNSGEGREKTPKNSESLEKISKLSERLGAAELCRRLDITDRTLRDYLAGRRPVPRAVELACTHLLAETAPPALPPKPNTPQAGDIARGSWFRKLPARRPASSRTSLVQKATTAVKEVIHEAVTGESPTVRVVVDGKLETVSPLRAARLLKSDQTSAPSPCWTPPELKALEAAIEEGERNVIAEMHKAGHHIVGLDPEEPFFMWPRFPRERSLRSFIADFLRR